MFLQSYGTTETLMVSFNDGPGEILITMFQEEHQHGHIRFCLTQDQGPHVTQLCHLQNDSSTNTQQGAFMISSY